MSASSRWLLGIALATAALVAAGLLVASLVDREVEYDQATPEGTVQAYLRAVAEADATAAYAFYSADLQAECDISYTRDSVRWNHGDFRASLRDVVERDDGSTEVRINLTQNYGSGPFDRNESTFEQVFVVQPEADGWRFIEAPWPSWCPNDVAGPKPAQGANLDDALGDTPAHSLANAAAAVGEVRSWA